MDLTVSPIHLTSLRLDNFRNYQSLAVDLDSRHVVLFGDNGAGKTNLLEAVSFLTPGRGIRRAGYEEIARATGPGSWTVFAQLQGAQGSVSIGTGIQNAFDGSSPGRKIRIDGTPAKSSETLLDHCRILWLTPAMDGLFTGPASDRRRFLDRMVLAVDPAHGKRVASYERTMRNRNKLLKEEFPDPAWLDAIEAQLAEIAVAIAFARVELVSLLSRQIIATSDAASPFPDALVALDGTLEALALEVPSGDLEQHFIDQLAQGRRLDAAAGRTLQGPHRSDLQVNHRPKSMAAGLCSTGEQKALLIGLILAHARLVGELAGFPPILLLDEVAAHLDEGRRTSLYDRIDGLGCQAWMTGTDQSLFEGLHDRAQRLHVSDATVKIQEH